MSIYSLGARGAVLAVMLALAAAPTAFAGTYQSSCNLLPSEACTTALRAQYDSHYANNPNNKYIGSWLYNPSTGTTVSFTYGFGVAGGTYMTNTTTSLDGYWGNFEKPNVLVWVLGTFEY